MTDDKQKFELFFSFQEKWRILQEWYGDNLDPHDFYMELFNDGVDLQSRSGDHDGQANVIVVSKENHGLGKEKRYTIHADNRFQDIADIPEDEFAFMSPISYFGKNRTLKNARFMYAMTIDLDGVGKKQLLNLLTQIDNEVIPRPTYIANSGTGMHLYYKFDTPVPMYPAMQEALKELKHTLTSWVWNTYTSTIRKKQYQSINQGFRLVGGETKVLLQMNEPFDRAGKHYDGINMTATVGVWRTGQPVTLSYLEDFLSLDIGFDAIGKYSSHHTLEECKAKIPEWYQRRIVEKKDAGQWTVKRDLYDWWIEKVKEGGADGHRYWCLYALATYAVKCDISFEELKKDAAMLQPILSERGIEPFTTKDMRDALRLYSDQSLAARLTRRYIEEQTAIPMPANKRNYRSQEQHIKIMNAVRDVLYPNGEWRGRSSKGQIVAEWRHNYPEGKKIDCSKETGLHINTVYKWWNEPYIEIDDGADTTYMGKKINELPPFID